MSKFHAMLFGALTGAGVAVGAGAAGFLPGQNFSQSAGKVLINTQDQQSAIVVEMPKQDFARLQRDLKELGPWAAMNTDFGVRVERAICANAAECLEISAKSIVRAQAKADAVAWPAAGTRNAETVAARVDLFSVKPGNEVMTVPEIVCADLHRAGSPSPYRVICSMADEPNSPQTVWAEHVLRSAPIPQQ